MTTETTDGSGSTPDEDASTPDEDASTPETPETPVEVHGADGLDELVAEHQVVLADFYADWCGPCVMLEPVVEGLAADTAAAVAKVDVDASPSLAAAYGVQGVPTVVVFADGEPVERLVGLRGDEELRSVLREHA